MSMTMAEQKINVSLVYHVVRSYLNEKEKLSISNFTKYENERRKNLNNKVSYRCKTDFYGLICQSHTTSIARQDWAWSCCVQEEHTGMWYLLSASLFIYCDSSQSFFDLKRKTKS